MQYITSSKFNSCWQCSLTWTTNKFLWCCQRLICCQLTLIIHVVTVFDIILRWCSIVCHYYVPTCTWEKWCLWSSLSAGYHRGYSLVAGNNWCAQNGLIACSGHQLESLKFWVYCLCIANTFPAGVQWQKFVFQDGDVKDRSKFMGYILQETMSHKLCWLND